MPLPAHTTSSHLANPVMSTLDTQDLLLLHSSPPLFHLAPHPTVPVATSAFSLVTFSHKLVFTRLQLSFLKFDAGHVILKIKSTPRPFASAKHVKSFVIWPNAPASFLFSKPMAPATENAPWFTWQMAAYPSRPVECLFSEGFSSVFRQSFARFLGSHSLLSRRHFWWSVLMCHLYQNESSWRVQFIIRFFLNPHPRAYLK